MRQLKMETHHGSILYSFAKETGVNLRARNRNMCVCVKKFPITVNECYLSGLQDPGTRAF